MRRVNPTVSVIIPCYNHGSTLGQAIDSVLAQRLPPLEVVVVDDGSTDDTAQVAAGYGPPVRYLWQENRGLSAARNEGIRQAQGEYVALLDADDLYEPEFLCTMVPLLHEHPEVAAAYCGFRFVDGASKPLYQVESRAVPTERFYSTLLEGNFLAAQCLLVRKSCYQGVGPFDEMLSACEDWDMWLRIAREHKVLGLDRVLSRVRILPGSMSGDPARMLENRLAVLHKHIGPAKDAPDVLPRRAYGLAYLRTAIEYLEHQDPTQAQACLREMVAFCPELLSEVSVFYELGCGGQPKGMRGDLVALDVERNGEVLLGLLGGLFDGAERPAVVERHEPVAYGTAYLALGLLSYGAGQARRARSFLARSIAAWPRNALDRRVVLTLAKSFGRSAIERWRQRGVGAQVAAGDRVGRRSRP